MSGNAQARHYELMVVINSTQAEAASDTAAKLRRMIEDGRGSVSRFEDCKVRSLAYRINKLRQGHYFLINFSCSHQDTVDSLQQTLKTSPNIIRSLLFRCDRPVSNPSPLAAKEEQEAAA